MKNKNVNKGKKFKNRDLDWLRFNERVLQEATDPSNPIYERLKFLAIYSSNLDEFFKVRVSKLRQIKKVAKDIRHPLALKPNKTLKSILKEVHRQQERFGEIFREDIKPGLAQYKIHILELSEFNGNQRKYLRNLFTQEIQPHIRFLEGETIQVDHFKDGSAHLVIHFKDSDTPTFVTMDHPDLGRFVEVPDRKGSFCFAFIEDVIKLNAPTLLPGESIKALYTIKVSRDAELYLEDVYQGEWIQRIYDALDKRQDGQPTRLLFEGGMPKILQKQIGQQLGLGKIDMVSGGAHHNFSDFFGFPNPLSDTNLFYEPFPPLESVEFKTSKNSFKVIREKDRILHFPYYRFDHLENWVDQAANDPKVVSIQISLYRIAKDSALTRGLIKAMENGKEVTIFVEAKARFDERNNLDWGKIFEEKGGSVHYSFPNVKVHSKILLITRKEHGQNKFYGYIGTGNFNAKTAKLYCDHALFTANPEITRDLEQVFLVLQRKVLVPRLNALLVSPYNSRLGFEHLVQNEIDMAQQGKEASIKIKMNSLEDLGMIEWLYRASQAGVKVKLLVRGFCCLIPGVKDLSENIQIISIVDRFLEHGRLFLFHNGGDEQMYMGSADWMTRNLDYRIEVITPILDREVLQELKDILHIQLSDNVKARHIDKESNNVYVKAGKSDKKVRSQYEIYDYLKSRSAL
ncbi:polyphosphate kinase 1 [Arenibacter sp. F20364]|uniref:polyphosphate kinase 1 n=1 Tax=Arenibacter sp. F20364 TaxID=2926415 RepID=UPI001FF41312|nr:polyphosphate kinase 1 [Arenibacter sp. F20364]MCK0189423.1 polyphosphate kinase 1 [Arenibacter sp. F20364]